MDGVNRTVQVATALLPLFTENTQPGKCATATTIQPAVCNIHEQFLTLKEYKRKPQILNSLK